MSRPVSVFPRVFIANAALYGTIAALLLFSPVRISAPITRDQAVVVVAALVVTLLVNAPLLRIALTPLTRLAREMEAVDLLRPSQPLPVVRGDEIGRVVASFNRMLNRLERERKESLRRIVAAQEAEREGIARDLHDEVGQVLTTVLLELDSTLDALPPARREEIVAAKQSVRQAVDEVRRISGRLRPEMLDELGLASALIELARTFSRSSGIRVQHRLDRSVHTLDPDAELAVYRAVQESLTNVARHAQATRVTISLEHRARTVVVRVTDDGRGLDAGPPERGGLRGMRERALLIGAELAVEQTPAGGLEVRLEVPVARVGPTDEAAR